ncbi:MAG: hypothetical protein JO250_12095 [Armatimonadetes bacterium]|nr:hypothetical protein [Armatimonadota bacterium]
MTTSANARSVAAVSAPARQGQRQPDYQRHPGSEWIDIHRASLPNNEWAAANQAGLVGTAPSIDDLMAKVRAQNIEPADVAIAFITADAL